VHAPQSSIVGKEFEIYLRVAPVPHLQSAQELLDLMTDTVLLSRVADFENLSGGAVPAEDTPSDPRRLQDTDPSIEFEALGVEAGDIILIDPAGPVQGPSGILSSGQERGARPFGYRSVPSRTQATAGQ